MKMRLAIRIAAVALSITPATAADRFPPPTRFYPPSPLVRVYSWTGCYLGAQLGGAFADNKVNGQFVGCVVRENDSATAATVGGQVGCDLQFARNWVIGAQIDGAWTHLNGSERITGTQGLPQQGHFDLAGNLIVRANVIATATGRIGYATNFDTMAGLFYVKGGGAFVNYDTDDFRGQTSLTTCAAFDPATGCKAFNNAASSAFDFNAPSSNRFGWTVGVGTEWAVSDNLSVFGEWDYLSFGTKNVTFTDANLGSTQFSLKQQINVLKLGINYRFGSVLPQQYP